MVNPNQLGNAAETVACDFLQSKGLVLLQRNYRCKAGEIDIIMQDVHELVFVEVRLRNNKNFGDALESVNFQKQRKIFKAATQYLLQKQLYDEINCRFDVIGISYAASKVSIDWTKDAFSTDDL